MRSKLRLDIYSILIVALVPAFLAIAWGLTWNHERVIAKQECGNTGEYLADVADIASLYESSGTVQNADVWLTRLDSIVPTRTARNLHDSVLSTIRYAMNATPELDTTQPGAVYEELPPFQQAIDRGRGDIVDQCPEFAALIPEAFPMFFREGNQ